ncbi:hypothetical protein AnigIFM62618_005309 [Aspergillus niger]|nr:hypothetical protein AnigIFM62618_005309 [Aspergillus niger]
MAAEWRDRAQKEATKVAKEFGTVQSIPMSDYTLLLLFILLNSIDITDGTQPSIGGRLRRCKEIIFRDFLLKVPDSAAVSWIVRNIAFHDVLCTSSMLSGEVTVSSMWWTARDSDVDTLMGVCQPIFRLVGKFGQLSHIRRAIEKKGRRYSSDLDAVYKEAKFLEMELKSLECGQSHGSHHRIMFELHRCATLLFLYNTIYEINAASLVVQSEVSRIRAMRDVLLSERNTPTAQSLAPHRGILHTSHWIVFNAAVNSITDPDMVRRDYISHMKEYPFRNVEKSFEVVEKVWQLNRGGTVAVSWLEIVERAGIELVFV